MMNLRRSLIVLIALMILDQSSKIYVESFLPFQERVTFLPFLSWYRTWNEGIAFSFLADLNDWLLVGFTLVIIGFVIWIWRSTDPKRWLSHLGFAAILGGALGNLIDRAYYGHVVDFISFHVGTWSFAIFNLADAFISVGAAAIVLDEVLNSLNKDNRSGAAFDTEVGDAKLKNDLRDQNKSDGNLN